MTRSDKEWKRRRFKVEEAAVRAIFNEWDPIAESPEDEYDCLVHELISKLHHGATRDELDRHIQAQFREHFGLPQHAETTRAVADQVWNWWEQRMKT